MIRVVADGLSQYINKAGVVLPVKALNEFSHSLNLCNAGLRLDTEVGAIEQPEEVLISHIRVVEAPGEKVCWERLLEAGSLGLCWGRVPGCSEVVMECLKRVGSACGPAGGCGCGWGLLVIQGPELGRNASGSHGGVNGGTVRPEEDRDTDRIQVA